MAERGQESGSDLSRQVDFSADRKAPVFAAGEIHVVASPQVVWDVVARVDDWPNWNAGISEVSLEGPFAPGTTFRWRAGRSRIVSTLKVVDPPNSIGWIGKTFGVRAIHLYEIRPAPGGVNLRTEESWTGLLARLLSKKLNAMLSEAVDQGLAKAKAEAERRAGVQSEET